jgi:hypothetical protein
MRNDAAPQRPGNRLSQVIVRRTREDLDSIGTSANTLKPAARRQQAQLRRVDSEVARITDCQIPVLLRRSPDQLVPDHVL